MADSAAPHAYADVVWNARTAHLRRAGFRRYHWQPIPDSPGELLPHGRGLPIRPGSFAWPVEGGSLHALHRHLHETYRLQQFEPIVERIVDVDVKLTAQIHH